MEDLSLIAGLGRSSGGGHGNPFQYSCLENPHGQKSLAGNSPWVQQRVGHDWVTKHWIFIGRTDAEAEAPIFWPPEAKSYLIGKDPWFWERLKAEGEGGKRGWDDWMASSTQWTWVWANSRRQWRTAKPSVLQCMGWQRVRHNWVAEQQPTFL